MKRLAICLQRIGDILTVSPILRAIKEEHPTDELHLLIHRECEIVVPLLKDVDHFHFFERKRWQQSLGEIELSGWEAFLQLESLVSELKSNKFNHIYNLSHTRMAAWLTGLIGQNNFTGVRLERMGHAQFSSNWFEDLDRLEQHKPWETFNVADYMRLGCGINRSVNQRRKVGSTVASIVGIQLFTSDEKKNFPLQNWTQVAAQLVRLRDDLKIVLLAAPFERESAERWMQTLPVAIAERCELLIGSLEEASKTLEKINVLITGDTSIKHLAALVNTPVLEIALGSSNVNLNGVYTEGSLIVRSRARCFPCTPRGNCQQTEHFCSKDIDPAVVAMLTTQVIDGIYTQVRPIAEEYRGQLEILRVVKTHDGLWHAIPFAERFGKRIIEDWIQRCFKATQMTNCHRDTLVSYAHLLQTLFPYASVMDWQQVFNDLVFPKDKEFIKKELIQCLKHSS